MILTLKISSPDLSAAGGLVPLDQAVGRQRSGMLSVPLLGSTRARGLQQAEPFEKSLLAKEQHSQAKRTAFSWCGHYFAGVILLAQIRAVVFPCFHAATLQNKPSLRLGAHSHSCPLQSSAQAFRGYTELHASPVFLSALLPF